MGDAGLGQGQLHQLCVTSWQPESQGQDPQERPIAIVAIPRETTELRRHSRLETPERLCSLNAHVKDVPVGREVTLGHPPTEARQKSFQGQLYLFCQGSEQAQGRRAVVRPSAARDRMTHRRFGLPHVQVPPERQSPNRAVLVGDTQGIPQEEPQNGSRGPLCEGVPRLHQKSSSSTS